ncbi:MAG: hypothetical protein ABSE73_11825 [Planctomycetota bacterium]
MAYENPAGPYTAGLNSASEQTILRQPVPQEDGVVLRRMVLQTQDRARMKAIEQAQIEKYVSWNPY